MSLSKLLHELDRLALPPDLFAVFGSGPLAVRGIRESHDLDIIVLPEAWEQLARRYHPARDAAIFQVGNIEVCRAWLPWIDTADHLVHEAEVINGVRFVRLETVLEWKQTARRPKDVEDVRLIQEYLRCQKPNAVVS